MLIDAINDARPDLLRIYKFALRKEYYKGMDATKEWRLFQMLRSIINYASTLGNITDVVIEGKLACIQRQIRECVPFIPVATTTLEIDDSLSNNISLDFPEPEQAGGGQTVDITFN